MKISDLENYGLRTSQMRSDDFIHNGGWYNADGEKIGWGDLSRNDLQKLQSELPEGDVFYVLPEGASFWNFVIKNPGTIGNECETDATEKNPGMKYVREHVYWVMVHGTIYNICRFSEPGSKEYNGLHFTAVKKFNEIKL